MSERPAEPAESIRRNTLFGLAVQLSGALMTGLLTLFLVRELGPGDYGIFVLAVGVGTVLLLPADFGVSQSAARFIAERRGDYSLAGRILGDAISLKLLGAGVASLALIALAGPIASAYGIEDLEWPLRLVALAVFGQSMMGLFAGVFEAVGRNSLGFRLALSESVLEATSSIALVLGGAGVAGAAAGRAIGFCFGGLLGLVLAVRLLGRRSVRVGARPGWSFRRIATYAGALLVIDGAFALFTEIDVLLIGALLDAEDAGLFGAPLKMLAFVFYPGLALAAGVAPRLARGRSSEPNVGALEAAMRYLFVVQLAFVAPLLVWADPLVKILFGTEYSQSADVVRAFTPYVVLVGLAPLLSAAVNYMGEARRRVPLAIGALAINAGIDVWLLPEIGIVAGAIGTNVAMLVYVAGHLWICHTSLEIRWGPLLVTLARSLAAAAAMAAVLLAFGTSPGLSPILMVAGAALGGLAYAAAILLLREFSSAELSVAREALRRRSPRRTPVAPPPAGDGVLSKPAAPEAPVAAVPPSDPVADYARERGPSLRRLAGFLVVHSSCGAGFDFNRLGDGRFEAVCLGCGKRFPYSSPALEQAMSDPSEPPPPRPAAPRPAARAPAPPPKPPPVSIAARPAGRAGRAPRRGRRGIRLAIAAASALLAAAAAVAYLVATNDDDGATRPAPERTETRAGSEAAPAEQVPPPQRVRTDLYSVILPPGWETRSTADGSVLTPRAGGARIELFVARRPDLDLEAVATETAKLLADQHPGGAVTGPKPVALGGASGLRLTARYEGGAERATVTSRGQLRYVLLVEVDAGADDRTRGEAASIERSFRPAG
jgi:O-antigen/teichoic acid export membrane protein